MEKRTNLIEAIKEKLSDLNEYMENYYTENKDNPVADFVAWGWTEGDIDQELRTAQREFSEELEGLYPVIEKRFNGNAKEIFEFLAENSEVEYTAGIGCRTDELYSCQIGEMEEELDPELNADLAVLTDSEFEEVQRSSDLYIRSKDCGFAYYSDNYSRWSLVVDTEQVIEALAECK